VAASAVTTGIKFLNMLIEEIVGKVETLVKLLVDNTGAIALTKNNMTGTRTKHINISHHFVSAMAKQRELETVYVPTQETLLTF
jgi:hypothetical protein